MTGVIPQPQYYIAIFAYDKSGNVSTSLSNEASGNPAVTVAEPTGCDDARAPSAPTPPPRPWSRSRRSRCTATRGTNAVTLSWTKSTSPDLLGYRLYRSTDAAFTPDEDAGTSNRIADEIVLDKDKT